MKKKGVKFRSKFEELVYGSAPTGTSYESTTLSYTKVHRYKVDFTLPNGILIEVKGYFKSSDRSKMVLAKEAHPEKDIRLIFMRNNTLNKNSKTTYVQWAKKNGFKCSVGPRIPKSWTKEKAK